MKTGFEVVKFDKSFLHELSTMIYQTLKDDVQTSKIFLKTNCFAKYGKMFRIATTTKTCWGYCEKIRMVSKKLSKKWETFYEMYFLSHHPKNEKMCLRSKKQDLLQFSLILNQVI